MSDEAILSVENLAVELPAGADRLFAVEGVSFEIRAGETLAIVGESGSGKSMSANAVMGLLPPGTRVAQGIAKLDGVDLFHLDEAGMRAIRGRRIGMIFQEPMTALDPLMRVGDQIAEVIRAHGKASGEGLEKAVEDALASARISDIRRVAGSYPHQLSGGLRQRALIAMALAC